MKEKLTLTIEKETKKRAKKHAKAAGVSVSAMVEDYLNKVVAIADDAFTPEPGSVTASLAGSMPLDDDRPYKEILTDELMKKYRTDENTD